MPLAFSEIVSYLAAYCGNKRKPIDILRDWGAIERDKTTEVRKDLSDEELWDWALKFQKKQQANIGDNNV